MKGHFRALLSTVFCLLAYAGFFASTSHAAPWQVTKFEAHGGAPYDALGWRTAEYFTESDALSASAIKEIEDFLGETAELYASLGFADPVAKNALDSAITGQDGTQVIRVYVYPYEGAPLGWYTSGDACSQPATRRMALNINTLAVMDQGKLTDMAYQTLAHELFHAVQKASASNKGCGFNQWISEGTADAVAYYAARKLRNIKFEKELASIQAIKVYGARPYSDPLNTLDPKDLSHGYMTSSFWRYLAEVSYASRRAGNPPGAAPAEEDYRYLADLLNTPYQGQPDNVTDELGWLSDWISRYPQIPANLATVYAGFVTTFAEHVNTRIAHLNFIPNRMDWEPRWLARVFGECPFIGLVGDFTAQEHTVRLSKNAAGCFYMTLHPRSTQPDIQIEVTGTDLDALKQLRIGMQDGSFLSAPVISSRAGNIAPEHVASWNFPALRTMRMTFIVSNMADDPARTRPFDAKFKVMAGSYTFTLGDGQQGPLPAAPVYGPQQAASQSQRGADRPTRREIVDQDRADVLANPLSSLSSFGSTSQNLESSRCDTQRLALNLCGSQLVIDLEVVAFRQQRNMLEAGVFNSAGGLYGVGVQAMLDGRFMRANMLAEKTIFGQVGHKIRISIPNIEYGFTGSFDKAVIEVAKANDDYHKYRAYGPAVRSGLRTYSQPPAGRVTIEEYGPNILRGTFAADLIDEANPGPDEAPKLATTISGQFLIPSPWRGDPDFEIDEQAMRRTMVQNMLQSGPFGSAPMRAMIAQMGAPPASVCEAGFTAEEIEAMGFTTGCAANSSAGSVGIPQQCSCACDARGREANEPVCQQQCRAEWQTCPEQGQLSEASSGSDLLEAQVRELIALMQAKNIPQYAQDAHIRTFRSLPEPQRLTILQSYRD